MCLSIPLKKIVSSVSWFYIYSPLNISSLDLLKYWAGWASTCANGSQPLQADVLQIQRGADGWHHCGWLGQKKGWTGEFPASVFGSYTLTTLPPLSQRIVMWPFPLPQVYTVPMGGMIVRQPVSVGGSGSSYIYGFMDSNYKPGMTKEECLHFCTQGE